MTTPVQTLFNPSVGIQSLLPMADAEPLPDARERLLAAPGSGDAVVTLSLK